MKFCSNCGAELDPSAKFCTSCGAPAESASPIEAIETAEATEAVENAQPAESAESAESAETVETAAPAESSAPGEPVQPQPVPADAAYDTKPKKSKKKIGIIALVCCIALVAIVASVLIALNLFKSPADEFVSLHKKAYITPLSEGIASYIDLAEGKTRSADFSTDMTLSISGDSAVFSEDEKELLDKLTIDIKLDSSGEKALLGLTARYDDTELNGIFTSNSDTLGFYLPELDENYYTVSTDTLRELFGDAFSHQFLGSSVSASDVGSLGKLSAKDTQKLIDDLGEIIFSCVNKNNVTKSKEDVRLTYSRETVRCTVYTFTPSEKDLSLMLKKLAAYLKGSDAAYELFGALMPISYPYGVYYYGDDYIEELYDSFVTSISRNADDLAEELCDMRFSWSTAVKGKRIYSDRISFRSGGDSCFIAYESFGDSAKSRSDAILLADGDELVTIASEYERSGKKLSGKLIFDNGYDEGSVEYDFDTSKKSALGIYYGDITLRADNERIMKLTVEKGENGGSLHTLNIYPQYSNGGKLSLILTTTDKKSTVKVPSVKPVDISGYSEAQMADILEDMSHKLQDLLEDIPLIRGGYSSGYGEYEGGSGSNSGSAPPAPDNDYDDDYYSDDYTAGYDDGYWDGYDDSFDKDYYGKYYGSNYNSYEYDYSKEYSNGYNNGYEAGYNDGCAENNSYNDAYTEGWNDGYGDGYLDGSNDDYYGKYYGDSYDAYKYDYSEEYSNGYNDGYEAGYNDGL